MTLTELRDTFDSVSDAVPVPVPDAAAFERRVGGVRRRRTAIRAAGAVAAVAVVAAGSSLVLSPNHNTADRTASADDTAVEANGVPVVVDGHLRIVDGGVLGAAGPAVASIVGTTAHGVVVLTEDGTLGRLEPGADQLQQLVPDKVRAAYLDGDAVVYENMDSLIRWRGIEPTVESSDSAQTEVGRLEGAGENVALIVGGPSHNLMMHTARGATVLELHPGVIMLMDGVDVAGGIVAVVTDLGVQFFDTAGTELTSVPREGIGSLSPDGRTYVRQTSSREAAELIDPLTAAVTPVEGPSGPIVDLGWASDGDLLAVVQHDGVRTLWRCAPAGTGCAAEVDDPTMTLRLS
jgi:hypothetical protein